MNNNYFIMQSKKNEVYPTYRGPYSYTLFKIVENSMLLSNKKINFVNDPIIDNDKNDDFYSLMNKYIQYIKNVIKDYLRANNVKLLYEDGIFDRTFKVISDNYSNLLSIKELLYIIVYNNVLCNLNYILIDNHLFYRKMAESDPMYDTYKHDPLHFSFIHDDDLMIRDYNILNNILKKYDDIKDSIGEQQYYFSGHALISA